MIYFPNNIIVIQSANRTYFQHDKNLKFTKMLTNLKLSKSPLYNYKNT